MIKAFFVGGGLGMSVLAPSAVSAQAINDIQDAIIENNQIEDVLKRGTTIGDLELNEENEIDGEAGIFILKKNDIFYVAGSLAGSYSSNAARTFDNLGGSMAMQAALSAGVQTQLGGSVDLWINASVSGVEYDKDFAPSSRNINGLINIGVPIGDTPLYVEGNVSGGINYDEDFSDPTKFYSAAGRLSAILRPSKKVSIQPSVGFVKQWSDLEENNNQYVSGMLRFNYFANRRLTMSLDLGVDRSWYDDFYEDVTFVERKDWDYTARAGINYRVNKNLILSLSGGYARRTSSFFLSEYDNFDAAGTATLRLTF